LLLFELPLVLGVGETLRQIEVTEDRLGRLRR